MVSSNFLMCSNGILVFQSSMQLASPGIVGPVFLTAGLPGKSSNIAIFDSKDKYFYFLPGTWRVFLCLER